MSAGYRTSAGGGDGHFDTTDWTCIVSAATDDPARKRLALAQLAGTYWKPVYCYLRRTGSDNEQAKDLTQGFFLKLMEGPLLQRAAPQRGNFRTFLLTSLRNFVRDCHRRDAAQVRAAPGGLIALGHLPGDLPAHNAWTPQQAFDYAWAAALLDTVITDVREQCLSGGRGVHWHLFDTLVLGPLWDDSAPDVDAACAKWGIADRKQASNKVQTVKRCFRRTLRAKVRWAVGPDGNIEQEIRELMEILRNHGAADGRELRTGLRDDKQPGRCELDGDAPGPAGD